MRLYGLLLATLVLCLVTGACSKSEPPPPDNPRLAAGVSLQDINFHSAALARDVTYRVILPGPIPTGKKLPVLYLLHGGGGGFHDWSNYSDVAQFAARGVILVMPEGASSYYMNAAEHPQDRYEDFVTRDLMADVEQRFPAATDRAHRAIAGVSMGGFGAVTLALKHPELYSFVAGMSSALDVPSRSFSWKRIGQWRAHKAIFGEWGGEHRKQNDPFVLVRNADPKTAPYFFLSCGDKEGLLPANRSFAALLQKRGFAHEFHVVPGGHDWNQWNKELPSMLDSLAAHEVW